MISFQVGERIRIVGHVYYSGPGVSGTVYGAVGYMIGPAFDELQAQTVTFTIPNTPELLPYDLPPIDMVLTNDAVGATRVYCKLQNLSGGTPPSPAYGPENDISVGQGQNFQDLTVTYQKL
jgi:hypothetical protein